MLDPNKGRYCMHRVSGRACCQTVDTLWISWHTEHFLKASHHPAARGNRTPPATQTHLRLTRCLRSMLQVDGWRNLGGFHQRRFPNCLGLFAMPVSDHFHGDKTLYPGSLPHSFEFEWRFYAHGQSASKVIFRVRTYNRIPYSVR